MVTLTQNMVAVYSLAENISILVSFQAGIVGRIWWFIFKVLNIALQKDHRVSVVIGTYAN